MLSHYHFLCLLLHSLFFSPLHFLFDFIPPSGARREACARKIIPSSTITMSGCRNWRPASSLFPGLFPSRSFRSAGLYSSAATGKRCASRPRAALSHCWPPYHQRRISPWAATVKTRRGVIAPLYDSSFLSMGRS
jgi:hypothetical protein